MVQYDRYIHGWATEITVVRTRLYCNPDYSICGIRTNYHDKVYCSSEGSI